MDAKTILSYVLDHWDAILGVLTAAHALALAIINLTSTPNPDSPRRGPYRFVELMAGVITKKAKE